MKTGICTAVLSCHDDFTVCVVMSAFVMTNIENFTNIKISLRSRKDISVYLGSCEIGLSCTRHFVRW